MKKLVLLGIAAVLLAACNTVPPTNIHQPMTARPAPRPEGGLAATGSIFQSGSTRPLFEDRRARYVGDTLTISIVENNAASTKSNSEAQRSGSISASVGPVVGLPIRTLDGLAVTASDTNNFSGKGDSAATNVFTGLITVTVIEVLSNGNLLVSGEKQVSITQGQEFIRLSGIVNPTFINSANTINSSQVADAKIEYKQSGYISDAQVMGWLARFFLTVLPF